MAKNTLDKKSKYMMTGLNHSTSSQLKRLKNLDTSVELPQVPLGNLYFYDKKTWTDKGKFCYSCSKLLGFNEVVIDKHRYICKGRI